MSIREPPGPGQRRRIDARVLLPAFTVVGVLVIASIAIALSSSSKPALPGGASSSKSPAYAGSVLQPAQPAPPIALRNYNGQPFSLAAQRGKVVLVTFLYTHCPDVCPLIASQLRVVQSRLGADAARVQMVAVSVDPKGDTPASVAAFLKAHDMTGRMEYLIGSAGTLAKTWKAWNVGSQRDNGNPELVAHSALIYGISASGKATTIYAANFSPSDVVHDVPSLLRN